MNDRSLPPPLRWAPAAIVAAIYALVLVALAASDEPSSIVGVLAGCGVLAAVGTLLAARLKSRAAAKATVILFVLGLIAQFSGAPRSLAVTMGGFATATLITYLAQSRYRAAQSEPSQP